MPRRKRSQLRRKLALLRKNPKTRITMTRAPRLISRILTKPANLPPFLKQKPKRIRMM